MKILENCNFVPKITNNCSTLDTSKNYLKKIYKRKEPRNNIDNQDDRL